MRFIDLYAGIGGFRYALESLGHKCVFSAEKDKFAIETYYKNFPDHNPSFDMDILADMSSKEIDKIIPDHDILCAGFPCQPFSMGGKKLGFNEARGTQFFNVLRVLEAKKPKYVFLENVANIISHDDGNTFKTIKQSLLELSYQIQEEPIIVSPHEIGIPQRRERAFFFAEYKKKPVYPTLTKVKQTPIVELGTGKPLDDYYQRVILAWEDFAKNVQTINDKKIPDIWLDEMISGEKPKKSNPEWKNKYLITMAEFYKLNKNFIDSWLEKHNALKFERRERKFEWRAGKTDNNFETKILMLRTSGLRVMDNEIFPTLVAMAQTPIIFDNKIKAYRHLTVKEVSKLQSFPEDFIPNSNESKAMKQFGNSVNVEVIKQIAKSFIK